MIELNLQKAREELAREEEEKAEKARKEKCGRTEVAVAVEIIRRREKNVSRPVT